MHIININEFINKFHSIFQFIRRIFQCNFDVRGACLSTRARCFVACGPERRTDINELGINKSQRNINDRHFGWMCVMCLHQTHYTNFVDPFLVNNNGHNNHEGTEMIRQP